MMFANLKKKIQETESESRRGVSSSPASLGRLGVESSPIRVACSADGQQETSSKQSLHKIGSRRSFDGIPFGQSKNTSENTHKDNSELTEDVLHKYKNAAQYEILKSKVLELTGQLERQNEKINQLEIENKNLQNQLSKSTDINKEILKKKDKEFTDKWKTLEKEKRELEEKLSQSKSQVDKLVAQQENTEEVESFQKQEMAKIKHLLLKSQQEVRRQEESLKNKCSELQLADQKLSMAESELMDLKQQVENAKQQLGEVNMLQEEKKELAAEVDRLKQETLKTANRMAHLEKILGDLTDEHDALKHMNETYKSKTSILLEEKDNHILYLEGRVTLLEKRLDDSALTGDDKMQALVAERDALEKRLEESRHHLADIKTTWSEKINSLETQIFHLNRKMAEDSDECSGLETRVSQLSQELQEKEEENWKLYEKLQEIEEALTQQKTASASNVDKINLKHKEYCDETETTISKLESTLNENIANWNREKEDLKTRINELEAVQTECLEKEIEMERNNSTLEDECRKLRGLFSEKEKECESLTAAVVSLKSSQNEMENKVIQLKKETEDKLLELSSLQASNQERDSELQIASQERDNLLMRNAELSHQLELIRKEMSEEHTSREREREETDQHIQNLVTELHLAEDKVQEIKKLTVESIENSSAYVGLKATVADLESQLSEKNKTLRLQQQRLGDMKKALQKELRIQSAMDGLQPFDAADNAVPQQTDARLNFTQGKDFLSSKNDAHLNRLSDEDINFKYLKHVVFKFMTSREYEAQHLIKAVSVLLHFTPEEEAMIRETLEWKSSWFGSKPSVFKSHASHQYINS